MKKSLITLLVLGLISCALFVSCNSEVTASQGDSKDLVSVSFDGGDSKSLTATLEGFDKNAYYWKYAARKNVSDTSGLTSGETASYDEDGAVFIHEATPGLTGKVSGFSQGVWDFKLFAYKRSGAGTNASPYVYTHVYTGEATGVTLKKGSENLVSVTVSPYSTGTGTLRIDPTTLTPNKPVNVPTVSRFIKVVPVGGTEEKTPSSGTSYTLDAGAYTVTVTYKSNDIVYAEGTVVATVYPNLTTVVAGSVDELITYAQFDAEQNPDIITRTAGVDDITANDEDSSYTLHDTIVGGPSKVEAVVPGEAARKLLADVTEDPNASMSLALNVDTVDSTSTSVTYEISMTKVVTVDSEVSTSDVTNLGVDEDQNKYYAVATINLSTGLTGVSVTHDGHDMVNSESTSADEGYGVYSYDATTGILTIQTNTFSPFAVTYDGLSFGVAEVNGVKYSTLEAAVTAAQANDTVKLLCDTEGSGMSISKSITIDLNSKTYTGTKDPAGSAGTKTQLFQLLAGTTVTIKNGTLTSTADSGIKRIIQNYTDLTLDSVVVDGSNIGSGQYVCSFNCGNVNIKGATSFKIPENGVAFDSYYWTPYYNAGVTVTVETTGTIEGVVELDSSAEEDFKNSIVIKSGTFPGSLNMVKGNLEIQGGSFKYDPWKYVKDGYEAIFNTATNMWDVQAIPEGKVAKIGTTYYDTLPAAITASTTGQTVELLKNIDLTDILLIEKSVIIEGHYHDVSNTANRVIRITTANCDVKLYNLGVISKCTATSDVRGISFDDASDGSSLLINNCTIDCDGVVRTSVIFYTINGVSDSDNLKITIENGSYVRGWAAVNLHGDAAIVSIDGSTLVGENYQTGNSNAFSTIVIDGNNLNSTTNTAVDNVVSISNSTIIAMGNIPLPGDKISCDEHWISFQYGAEQNHATVTVDSNTIILDSVGGSDKSYDMYISGIGNYVILPLSADQLARVQNSYDVEETQTEGVYSVTSIPEIWYSNAQYDPENPGAGEYTKLNAPFVNGWIWPGEAVKLMKNLTLSDDITYVGGESGTGGRTYILMNGHTISGG